MPLKRLAPRGRTRRRAFTVRKLSTTATSRGWLAEAGAAGGQIVGKRRGSSAGSAAWRTGWAVVRHPVPAGLEPEQLCLITAEPASPLGAKGLGVKFLIKRRFGFSEAYNRLRTKHARG